MEIENQEEARNTEVPESVRLEIIYWKAKGYTGRQISEIVGRPISTYNSIYHSWMINGDIKDKPRSGRPPKLDGRSEKMLIEVTKANPSMSVSQLVEESKIDISKTTGWRTLKDNGFNCRASPEKWEIPEHKRKERLKWARHFIHMPEEFWFRVVFTDESRIQRNPKKQMFWVDEEMEVPTTESDRWQASVLIWGAIAYPKKSILEIVEGDFKSDNYLALLQRRLLRNLPQLNPTSPKSKDSESLIFQQDGASIHTTSEVLKYFKEHNIEVLSWPTKSPDLNLIESVWSVLKNKLKRSYSSREELVEDIQLQWKSISSELIVNLYCSMKRRIQAVIDSKGGPTDY